MGHDSTGDELNGKETYFHSVSFTQLPYVCQVVCLFPTEQLSFKKLFKLKSSF